jgi:thiol-disulfide isomerase/thioredoxin
MKKSITTLSVILSFLCYIASAQSKILPRSPLQQRYIIDAFIQPQLKNGGFKITDNRQIDSIFRVWEEGWRSVAADSMAANPTKLTKDEFNNLDAYCYFWGLASLTQNLGVGDDYASILTQKYMVPSLQKDLVMLKRIPLPEMIRGADLRNTIGIGSNIYADREAFQATYALYNDYYDYFKQLTSHADTNVSKAAVTQFRFLESHYYSMNARHSFYAGEKDKALMLLLTGLNVNKFSKVRAVDLSRKLIVEFSKSGEPDKAFALLNTLAINTTPDNLHRDTLAAWYALVDAAAGPKAYADLQSKLSPSSFKTAGKPVKLSANWNFVMNAIPAEKMRSAKFILVDFWYTGCGPCIAEIPELNAFYEKIKSRPDIVFVSVNTDYENGKNDPAFVEKRSKGFKIGYPVLYDNETSALNKQLNITGYPSKVILNAKGDQLIKTDGSGITLSSFEAFLKEQK